MLEKTDDEHGLTMRQILEELAKYGVDANGVKAGIEKVLARK